MNSHSTADALFVLMVFSIFISFFGYLIIGNIRYSLRERRNVERLVQLDDELFDLQQEFDAAMEKLPHHPSEKEITSLKDEFTWRFNQNYLRMKAAEPADRPILLRIVNFLFIYSLINSFIKNNTSEK